MAKTVEQSSGVKTTEAGKIEAFKKLLDLLEPLDKDTRSAVMQAAKIFYSIYLPSE